jgi:hypothetical protein
MHSHHNLVRHLVRLIGGGFVLCSLVGCTTMPTAAVSGVETAAYRHYHDDGGDRPHRKSKEKVSNGQTCERRDIAKHAGHRQSASRDARSGSGGRSGGRSARGR